MHHVNIHSIYVSIYEEHVTFALNKQDGSLNVVLHSQYVIEKSLIDIPCNIQTSLSDREKRFYVVIFVRKAAVSSAGHPCVS